MTLLQADARRLPLADGCVQCVVTSPPYWGLRDYGTTGQIGLEQTPDAYVTELVAVFREVRRVLRDDGVLWLNLGDSYATFAGAVGEHPGGGKQGARWKGDAARHRDALRRDNGRPYVNGRGEPQNVPTKNTVGPMTQPNRMPIEGLKPKDLIGIPWRVAFALQADGWYLRQDIIWHKPNPMPESVRDRCTKAHEYVFLLTKSERYAYDAKAIQEGAVGRTLHDLTGPGYAAPGQTPHVGNRKAIRSDIESRHRSSIEGGQSMQAVPDGTRNARSVWTIATQPYSGAHFATFPEALVERCVLAGSKPGDLVFDPFGGSGTTARVALSLGRRAVYAELNPAYLALARERTHVTLGLPLEVA